MELIAAVVGVIGVVVAILANTTNIVRFTQEQRGRRRPARTDRQGGREQVRPQPHQVAARPRILTPDQRLRVFVSSTLHDLAEEREAARETIARLGLSPVLFELGARPHPPRDLYRAYLEQSHVFVGIYWQRYGWIAPGETVSGLEDEYNLARGHPGLIYLKTPAEREPGLQQLIHRIQEDDHASYKPFRTAAELRELLANDLALLLSERFEGAEAPPAAPAAPVDHEPELPLPATPLVGREGEIAAVRELLLRDEVRLVTLYGPGGVGKTRLALAVAESVRTVFPDGVRFVPLESLQDARAVAVAIAQTLGLQETGKASPRELKTFLYDRKLLLVLDNLEHLPTAWPLVGGLLAAAPRLEFLATSRTLLRLSGEHAFQVPPLALPSPGVHELEVIGGSEAVRLFLERARAIRPDFDLTEANAPVVEARASSGPTARSQLKYGGRYTPSTSALEVSISNRSWCS